MKKLVFAISLLCSLSSLHAQCVGTSGEVTWMYWDEVYRYWDFDHDLIFLHEDDTYPNGPDYTRTLNSLSTPRNYNNDYGAVTKGFISVQESGPTTFNLTGDDYTVFLLSTDATAANLDTIAYIPDWTGFEEYNKHASQTSSVIQLNAGQLYYFELYNKEHGGGDHAVVRWQRPYLTDSTWLTVSSQFITSVCDSEICPPKSTPCDDGNAATYNDLEDGNCNCTGTADTTGLHVGERGVLDVYFFDDTGNGRLDQLNVPNYPSIPNSMTKQRNGLYMQWRWNDTYEYYAIHIQGYLTVPVTGMYDFNLTAAGNAEWRINATGPIEDPTHSLYVNWGTGMAEHDDSNPSEGAQTNNNIQLTAGTFYYFEFEQAMPDWGHYANVYWKTPTQDDDNWHMIPLVHLYDYTNESACILDGSTCDDGNPHTANDVVTNCECAGTPCTPGLDCDDPEAENFTYDYCDVGNELGNRVDDSWLSCSASSNPHIPARSGRHWIHYDLGKVYNLKTTRVWNYNVDNQEHLGFQSVIVDYSLDGEEWTQLGQYSWPQANGDPTYTGFEGPDFGSVAARYVMFTSLDAGACRGISKVAFTADKCRYEGEVCDDGDLSTMNDHFDENCNCIGYTSEELDCGTDTLFVNQMDLPENAYHAMMALLSEGAVLNQSNINFKAGAEIILSAGFEVELGGELEVDIEDCVSNAIALGPQKKMKEGVNQKEKPKESLQIYTIPESTIQTIRMYLPDATDVKLEVLSTDEHLTMPIVSHHYPNHGDFYKRLETKKLQAGVYLIKMTTDNSEYLERIVVM